MKLLRTVALVLCFVPLSCRSTAPREEVPCTCGTAEADIEGCAHPLCLNGERNPDNIDCVCGTLSIPK